MLVQRPVARRIFWLCGLSACAAAAGTVQQGVGYQLETSRLKPVGASCEMASPSGSAAAGVQPVAQAVRGHSFLPFAASKEEQLLDHVRKTAPAGDAQAVLDVIDQYAWSGHWYMNIGDVKGKILDEAVDEANPTVAVELGAYCGYSGVRIASRLKKPDARLFSIEFNGARAKVAAQMADHAGVSHKMTVLVGTIQSQAQALRDLGVAKIDLLLIDHDKNLYLRDLRFLIDEGLLQPGSVIVADNVLNPGAPDYLAHVTTRREFSTERRDAFMEYSKDEPDLVTVTTYRGAS